MTPTAIAAAKLLFTGFFLCLGFYGARKLTNKIDQFLFEHSMEFRQITTSRQDPSNLIV